MMIGACGKPIRRESCETVISVVDGIGVLLASEAKDAMFGLPPHEVIAQNPLAQMHPMPGWMSTPLQGCLRQQAVNRVLGRGDFSLARSV
jgi:hypothetical protein